MSVFHQKKRCHDFIERDSLYFTGQGDVVCNLLNTIVYELFSTWLCLYCSKVTLPNLTLPVLYPAWLSVLYPTWLRLYCTQRDSVLDTAWVYLYCTQRDSVCIVSNVILYYAHRESVCTVLNVTLYYTQRESVCTAPNVTPPVLYPAWLCLYLAKHHFTKRESACIVSSVILSVPG